MSDFDFTWATDFDARDNPSPEFIDTLRREHPTER